MLQDRKSMQPVADFLELYPGAVIDLDPSGIIHTANMSAAELLGMKVGSLCGRRFTSFLEGAADRKSFTRYKKELISKGATRSADLRLKKGPDAVFVQLQGRYVTAAGGGPVLRVALHDITKRKQAEEALRGSEQLYRAIGESINYGVWVCAPDGRNIYASDSFLKLVGLTQEQCSSFGWGDTLHPDDAARTIAAWKECVRTEGTWDIEHRFRGIDGQWHHILARGVPVHDEDGRISCWAGINLDISRLKQTEEKLRQSEERFRVIAAGTPDHVLVQDSDMRYTLVINPQLGFTEQEMLGRTDEEILGGDDAARLTAVKRQVIETGKTVSLEIPVAREGRKEFFEGAYVPKYDAEGRIDGLIGYFRNITFRREYEAALEQSLLRFGLLSETADEMLRSADPQRTVQSVCHRVMEHLGCHVFFNYMLDSRKEGLLLNAWAGIPDEEAWKISHLDYGVAICGCVARDGERIVAEHISTTRDPRTDLVSSYGVRAYCCNPIHGPGGKTIGTLSFGTRTRDTFSKDDILLMDAVTNQIASAMIRMRDEEALRTMNDELEQRVQERTSQLAQQARVLEDLYNNAPCGYHSLDKNGVIVRINNTELDWLGYSRAEVQGKKRITEFFTAATVARFEAMYPRFLAEGSLSNFECELIRRNGSTMQVLINGTAIFDKDGRYMTNKFTMIDITERKETEWHVLASNEVLRRFSETNLREEYIGELADIVRRWSGCDGVGIRLIDEQENIPFASFSGVDAAIWAEEQCLSAHSDDCICPRVITSRPADAEKPLMTANGSFVCEDIAAFVDALAPEERGRYLRICAVEGFRSAATVPIRYREKTLGAIHIIDRASRRITPKFVAFLESLMPLVGEALYRFYVEESLTKSRELLRKFSAHLQTAIEEERTRIAREVHDELGQLLTAISMELAHLRIHAQLDNTTLERVNTAYDLTDVAIGDVQRICSELRPRILDHLGLAAAIEWQIKQLGERSGLRCGLAIPIDLPRVPQHVAVPLFRIVQEALTNVIRHADATEVSIRLESSPHMLVLEIADNGRGIDSRRIYADDSFGLSGMRERVRELGGQLAIRGTKGEGTTITVTIPSRGDRQHVQGSNS